MINKLSTQGTNIHGIIEVGKHLRYHQIQPLKRYFKLELSKVEITAGIPPNETGICWVCWSEAQNSFVFDQSLPVEDVGFPSVPFVGPTAHPAPLQIPRGSAQPSAWKSGCWSCLKRVSETYQLLPKNIHILPLVIAKTLIASF